MFLDISRLRRTETRSICPENFTGAKGAAAMATEGTGAHCARDLGQGWKVSPSVDIAAGETFELGRIDGAGKVTQIWLTTHVSNWRRAVIRMYWDGATEPAVEVPLGDFFCSGWSRFAQVNSLMVAANPNGGFNSYWPMPFRTGARFTIENLKDEQITVYYQINYEIGDGVVDDEAAYLHAQFRRSNPLPDRTTHVLVDGVQGRGHYAGTYLAWGVNSTGWWGEGEVKFYLDGDQDHPTIASTGTEDYFGGAWNFDVPGQGYTEFTTPFLGMPQVIRPDGLYDSQQRFGMYRWHVPDPVTFTSDLRVDIQALGWQAGHRYLPLRDDIASTAWFYLDAPTAHRPEFPAADDLLTGV